jgi:Flp pilus assembly secretin CpaC
MRFPSRTIAALLCGFAVSATLPSSRVAAQTVVAPTNVEVVSLSIGRAIPIDLPSPVTQVNVTNPAVADIVVISERSVVLNAKALGETDILLSGPALGRRHLRVTVNQAVEQRQIALGIKFAEVRRDALYEFGVSAAYQSKSANVDGGTGTLAPGAITAASATRFVGSFFNFGTQDITAFIDAQEQMGRARSLAEPTLIAGNKDSATFLAGGELPVPVAQPTQGGQVLIVIQYRPFGVQLKFRGEVINDSLVKLRVAPEVSSLDFGNAVLLSGFRIPAIRTRRVETTVDVRPGESLVLSGLFNEERESVRTGIPGLMRLPIIGALFSSSRWQNNESELLVVVTPQVFDPNTPRGPRTMQLKPDSLTPAIEALRKRLPPD